MTNRSMTQNTDIKQPILSNFTVRLLTAIVLIPIGLVGARIGGVIWTAMLSIVVIVAAIEFYLMASGRWSQGSAVTGVPMALGVLLAFHVENAILVPVVIGIGAVLTFVWEYLRHPSDLNQCLWQAITTVAGVLYVGVPIGAMIALRNKPDGFLWIIVLLAVTWGTDTFAYFGGRAFGRRKLAPKLSPKKTIEGAIVGVIGGILPALLFLAVGDKITVPALIMICLAPLVAIGGDLFESALKRFFEVKDSHVAGLNLIPGHGGVLDRIDALLMVSFFFYVFMLLTGIS